LTRMDLIESQLDNVIMTTTGTYDVVLDSSSVPLEDALPYKTWFDLDTANGGTSERALHLGDIYIKNATSASTGEREYLGSWKFVHDNTPDDSTDDEGFSWAKIVNPGVEDALQTALDGYALADGKSRLLLDLGVADIIDPDDSNNTVTRPVTPPVPYDMGDQWFKPDGNVMICVNSRQEEPTCTGTALEWTTFPDNSPWTIIGQDIKPKDDSKYVNIGNAQTDFGGRLNVKGTGVSGTGGLVISGSDDANANGNYTETPAGGGVWVNANNYKIYKKEMRNYLVLKDICVD